MAAWRAAVALVTGVPAHAVLVLAAGSSRRLGRPKQLLQRDGEPLLRRATRLGAETGAGAVVVVVAQGQDAVAQALQGLPHVPVFNGEQDGGLASSLRAAAAQVRDFPHVLVLACDQPALTVAHLHALLHGARTAQSGGAATLLHGLPAVPAVVPGSWFDALPPASEDGGFRKRLRSLSRDEVFLLPDASLELDIDTPEDLVAAQALGLIDT